MGAWKDIGMEEANETCERYSPLGLKAPGAADVGKYFAESWKEAEARREELGCKLQVFTPSNRERVVFIRASFMSRSFLPSSKQSIFHPTPSHPHIQKTNPPTIPQSSAAPRASYPKHPQPRSASASPTGSL